MIISLYLLTTCNITGLLLRFYYALEHTITFVEIQQFAASLLLDIFKAQNYCVFIRGIHLAPPMSICSGEQTIKFIKSRAGLPVYLGAISRVVS